MTWLLSIMGAVALSFLISELTAWLPSLSVGLAKFAARKLPAPQRERYTEEWLGELDAVPGPLMRVMRALSLVLRARAFRTAAARGTTGSSDSVVRLAGTGMAEPNRALDGELLELIEQIELPLVGWSDFLLDQPGVLNRHWSPPPPSMSAIRERSVKQSRELLRIMGLGFESDPEQGQSG